MWLRESSTGFTTCLQFSITSIVLNRGNKVETISGLLIYSSRFCEIKCYIGIMKKRQRSSFRYSTGLHQRPDPSVRIPPCPKPVDLNLEKVPLEHRSSMLSRAVCLKQLPIAIRLTRGFGAKGSPVTLKSGELLLLCFVVEMPMVYGTLGKNTNYRLPIHAKQLYEKLPLGKFQSKLCLRWW